MSSYVTELQRAMDDIRSVMGWCPLYEGAIAEKDTKEIVSPIGRARLNIPRRHKCKYCNVNREGKHQDYCPDNAQAA